MICDVDVCVGNPFKCRGQLKKQKKKNQKQKHYQRFKTKCKANILQLVVIE